MILFHQFYRWKRLAIWTQVATRILCVEAQGKHRLIKGTYKILMTTLNIKKLYCYILNWLFSKTMDEILPNQAQLEDIIIIPPCTEGYNKKGSVRRNTSISVHYEDMTCPNNLQQNKVVALISWVPTIGDKTNHKKFEITLSLLDSFTS